MENATFIFSGACECFILIFSNLDHLKWFVLKIMKPIFK